MAANEAIWCRHSLAPAARLVAQRGLDKMAVGFTQRRLHASDAAE